MSTLVLLDAARAWGATASIAAYATLCVGVWWRHRRTVTAHRRARAALQPAAHDAPGWTVAYASQTGSAEDIALQTAQTLHLAGLSVRLCALDELDATTLAQTTRLLLVVSTYGEGDPPDNAARFARDMLTTSAPGIKHLHYGVLALGDRDYSHFCGFGRMLDTWLQAAGAQPLFERIEAHQLDANALTAWRHQLSHLAGTTDAPDWSGPTFSDWRLTERRLLNPGSVGAAVYHLELEPCDGPLPDWQAGDLAQILPPSTTTDGAAPRHRDYSIASLPSDGRVHLLVRLHRHADGTPGSVSGWLGLHAAVGERVALRLREHRAFQIQGNAARPLILIGNGTGMAGLRSHLKTRAAQPTDTRATCWLIFGERQAAHDFHHQAEITAWQRAGVLERLDAVFSRDQPERRYVQHALREAADTLRDWVERGAAIYVCGSLQGMASDVDQALRALLGDSTVEGLTQAGRYRRDVY